MCSELATAKPAPQGPHRRDERAGCACLSPGADHATAGIVGGVNGISAAVDHVVRELGERGVELFEHIGFKARWRQR